MKPLAIVLIVIVSAGVGLAVGTMIDGTRTNGDTANPPAEEKEILALETENARQRQTIEALTKDVETEARAKEELRTEVRALEEKIEAFKGLEPEGLASAAAEAATTAGPAPFFAERYNGVFKKVEWKEVGSSMGKMSALIKSIVPHIAKGESPDMQKVLEIQKLNQNLVKAAVTASSEMPGDSPDDINRNFTSPAFMVNAMASTLEAMKKPLTAAQRSEVGSIAAAWLAADEKRLAAYTDETPTVKQLYEEAELKDKFFADVHRVMSAEQVEALSPEVGRGRVRIDLFSSALIYVPRVRLEPFDDVKALSGKLTDRLHAVFGLAAEQKERVGTIVAGWLDEVPSDLLFGETNLLDLQGIVKTERVTAWGRHQVALYADLAHELNFDEKQRQIMARIGGIAVPVKKPEATE